MLPFSSLRPSTVLYLEPDFLVLWTGLGSSSMFLVGDWKPVLWTAVLGATSDVNGSAAGLSPLPLELEHLMFPVGAASDVNGSAAGLSPLPLTLEKTGAAAIALESAKYSSAYKNSIIEY